MPPRPQFIRLSLAMRAPNGATDNINQLIHLIFIANLQGLAQRFSLSFRKRLESLQAT